MAQSTGTSSRAPGLSDVGAGTDGWPLPRLDWEVREADESVATMLSSRLGLLPVTARVLAARGLHDVDVVESFLHPSLDRLHSPFSFAEMEAAVDRLLYAIVAGERIVVHGDYDVDGVTATVALVTMLRAVGGDVSYVVPHRMRDGYGLRPQGIDRAEEAGARVVVAVDCGITAYAAAERAREAGIDLIVADHHEPGDELPPAAAILNPRLPDSGYPEDDLAAVAVAFKLARGVLERHPKTLRGTSLLKLVALGTIADVVPLVGENRVIAHHGLATLHEAVNPGLRALLELAGLRRPPISASDVAFRVAPRINAAGRLGDAAEAVEMFLATDPGRARRLAEQLHGANARRQRVENEVLQEALLQEPDDATAVAVAAGPGWHRGVIGIVASRLVERWGRPAVVIAVEGDRAWGSARSLPGFNIMAALRGVAGLLDEFGGHPQAAGLELASSRLGELREGLAGARFEELEQARLRARRLRCDAELSVDEDLFDLALELERLSPFGAGNPRPRFLCRELRLAGVSVLAEDHLKLGVEAGGSQVEAVAWRRAAVAGPLEAHRGIEAVTTLRVRRWGGRARPQLELVDFRPLAR